MTHRVGTKGQVVIPKALRDELGLQAGDEVRFYLDNGGVVVEPARNARPLLGRFKDDPRFANAIEELEAEHQREIEKDERRIRRP